MPALILDTPGIAPVIFKEFKEITLVCPAVTTGKNTVVLVGLATSGRYVILMFL